MTNHSDRIKAALGAMTDRPRALVSYLQKPGPDFEAASDHDLEKMLSAILSPDPNNPTRIRFSSLLHSWDNAKDGEWIGQTIRNSSERRVRIHELLKSDKSLRERIDSVLPYYPLEEPLIIAEDHADWYTPTLGVRDYYWRTYTKYLKERRDWTEVALLNLDNSTRSILECLSNPESQQVYSSRGLVMGYVQSGKTANFAGLVARAADAGYRLIVVLAGTWNILRNQTQRRFDKELLGKELLHNDDTYQSRRPADWDDFLEHGAYPADLGHYTWQRLTRPDIDFKGLKAAIDSLEYEKRHKHLPLHHPDNLHHLPVKLLVVKKNSSVLRKLAGDLGKLKTRLAEIPTLVIDDESDQAGLNTVDPAKAQGGSERTATNEGIIRLLKLLPRGQYVGYSATPYANALVNPDDPEDLFPKDFIISLDRPIGYMGVSDFFDPFVDYDDLKQGDFSQPELAFIRRVEASQTEDDDDLKRALRSYVLAGAMKLYRQSADAARYKPESLKHHTMLIHTSSRKGVHASLAERILDLWDQCAFNSPDGLNELRQLWEADFLPVCQIQGKDELTPASFSDLKPHLAASVQKITRDSHFVRVVNSDKDEAPDFTHGPVWKIVVGGNKLSRGYTVEGLTVSYYRRVANTADTLMQMGRWFGFRPGYRDLVRVFLGVQEGRDQSLDLVGLFKEVCRMEERFREEIKRYVRRPDAPRITPRQIPPLIAISGNLPPTSRNKMFNAVVAKKNFGGRWSMPTLTAATEGNLEFNVQTLSRLIKSGTRLTVESLDALISDDDTPVSISCAVFRASNTELVQFLSDYRWLEDEFKHPNRPSEITLQIEFLKRPEHEIESWLIIAPQRQESFGPPLRINDREFAVKNRSRINGRGFKVFGESRHRTMAEFLAGIKFDDAPWVRTPGPAAKELASKKNAVMLLYPVRESEERPISVGFEMLFPANNLPFDLGFTVRRKSESARIVVQTSPASATASHEEDPADRGIH
jgi:hypothetical protein